MKPVSYRSDDRNDEKNTPEPVHDTGDGCQQVGDILQDDLKSGGQKFLRENNGNRHPKESSQCKGQDGAVERPPDFGEDAELASIDVPGGRGEKVKAEFLHSGSRVAADFPEDEDYQENREPGKGKRQAAKRPVQECVKT